MKAMMKQTRSVEIWKQKGVWCKAGEPVSGSDVGRMKRSRGGPQKVLEAR